MPLDKEQGSMTLRTSVRRGYATDRARAEARAMVMTRDALEDLGVAERKRVMRYVASYFGFQIKDGWLHVGE